MKILFLDFDGVLNTRMYQTHCLSVGEPPYDAHGALFDPVAVGNLKKIIDSVPGLRIVVASSWKVEGLGSLRRMWADRKLPGSIFDKTPDLLSSDFLSADLSDPDVMNQLEGRSKAAEIRAWLEVHAAKDCRYAIQDDVPFFPKEVEGHYVHVNPVIGITEEDVEKTIYILQ